ncbi:MAG: 7-cyano-7-deazaguanine synthase QueC, partial [bacterium]
MDGKPRAVALISGGMDSAVAAALAREAGEDIYALSVDYGQRHRHELEAAGRVARWLGAAEHKTVSIGLSGIGGSALTDNMDVPKNRQDNDIPVTYVPGRNIIFLSVALSWAEVINARAVVIGANAVDFSGYPDCTPEFLEAFRKVAGTGTRAGVQGSPPVINAPLLYMDKAEIVRQGARLGLDFGIT